ncbi:MAG: hypothetical protein RL637_1317 [Pseudomonadota bacterium]
MADLQLDKESLAKYTTDINEAALEGLVKTYALVMRNQDSSTVACSDVTEKETVRENFLKKKLGLTLADEELDAAIESVCTIMKPDRFKSRITFYYLLAEKYEKLDLFIR